MTKGCLVDAWVLGSDERRNKCDKLWGVNDVDPGISEWGNPLIVYDQYSETRANVAN